MTLSHFSMVLKYIRWRRVGRSNNTGIDNSNNKNRLNSSSYGGYSDTSDDHDFHQFDLNNKYEGKYLPPIPPRTLDPFLIIVK